VSPPFSPVLVPPRRFRKRNPSNRRNKRAPAKSCVSEARALRHRLGLLPLRFSKSLLFLRGNPVFSRPPTLSHSNVTKQMKQARIMSRSLLRVLIIALMLATCGVAQAQTSRQRPPVNTRPRVNQQRQTRQPGANLPAPAAVRTGTITRCFVPNCPRCNNFNPYFCAECGGGYALTSSFSCSSCAPGFEQNLDVQTFTCSACPPGTTSNGGTGAGSQCQPITTTTGRRLFSAEDDIWA
jgi:hypothetical protein